MFAIRISLSGSNTSTNAMFGSVQGVAGQLLNVLRLFSQVMQA